jgi:hypothetical protein
MHEKPCPQPRQSPDGATQTYAAAAFARTTRQKLSPASRAALHIPRDLPANWPPLHPEEKDACVPTYGTGQTRRGKAGERFRFGMEAVDTFCGSWHAAAVNKSLAHDTKPAFKKEPWDFCMVLTVRRGKELLFAQERRGIFAEAL